MHFRPLDNGLTRYTVHLKTPQGPQLIADDLSSTEEVFGAIITHHDEVWLYCGLRTHLSEYIISPAPPDHILL